MTKPMLVSYGSKYGATEQIAHRIGQVLGEAGLHVDVRSAAEVEDLGPYRAVVIGSAVYAGQWRKEAAAFVRRHQEELRALPVWVFSSGPLGKGDPVALLRGWRMPRSLTPVMQRIAPRDVAVFHGALDVAKLNWFERTLLRMMKATSGDFRDWNQIESWARQIAAALEGQ